MREVEDELFLLDSKTGRIHHMNATAAALWRMLATPVRVGELTRLFSDAFPERTRRTHKRLIKLILQELDENALLQSASDAGQDRSPDRVLASASERSGKKETGTGNDSGQEHDDGAP